MKEALRLALEALEAADWYIDQLEMIVYCVDDEGTHENRAKVQAAITAIKEALAKDEKGLFIDLIAQHDGLAEELAQPEQEPVCEITVKNGHWIDTNGFSGVKDLANGIHKLYTTPPQRPWVGLTEAENAICLGFNKVLGLQYQEAKLKEKNT